MRCTLIFFLLFSFVFIHCGPDRFELADGGSIGDPSGDISGDESGSDFVDPDDPITQAVELICDAILGCYDPDYSEAAGCLDGVWDTEQIGDEFGIDEENEWNLDEAWYAVYDEEDSDFGTFTVNEAVAKDCHNDLEALTCDEVALGIDADDDLSSLSSYDNTGNFIPESCNGMIEEI